MGNKTYWTNIFRENRKIIPNLSYNYTLQNIPLWKLGGHKDIPKDSNTFFRCNNSRSWPWSWTQEKYKLINSSKCKYKIGNKNKINNTEKSCKSKFKNKFTNINACSLLEQN